MDIDEKWFLLGGAVMVFLWELFTAWREHRHTTLIIESQEAEIKKLLEISLEASRHLAYVKMSSDPIAAETAISRDRMTSVEIHRQTFSPKDGKVVSISGQKVGPAETSADANQFQAGGRQFSLVGINEEAEKEFIKNVIKERI